MGFSIERINKPFVVKSPYKPSGDQPQAIEELATRIENGENDVVLMGATGTGKTATTAWLIERLQPREREVIVRRYFRDETQAVIARDLGMTQVQVSRLESRILRQMREAAM